MRRSLVLAFGLLLVLNHAAFAREATSLTANVSGNSVAFRWQGEGSTWIVEAGSSPGLSNLASIPIVNAGRLFVVTVLPGTYYVRIRQVTNGVPGPASNEVEVVVGCRSAGELDLRATVSGFQVQFDWNPIGTSSGVQLEAGTAPGASNIAVLRFPTFPTRFIANGPAGTYYVRTRPVGQCGDLGAPSNEVRIDLGSAVNCVPTLSPFNRNVFVSGTYTVSITVRSECSWTVFTRDTRWITPLTVSGTGSGTIQYRVTLPGGGTGQLYITTSSGRFSVNVTS
jgi:hypothetical protein